MYFDCNGTFVRLIQVFMYT